MDEVYKIIDKIDDLRAGYVLRGLVRIYEQSSIKNLSLNYGAVSGAVLTMSSLEIINKSDADNLNKLMLDNLEFRLKKHK